MNLNIDTERVIFEMRLHPPLWDLLCKDIYHILYKDRDAKIKTWFKVCQAVINNYNDVSDKEKKHR